MATGSGSKPPSGGSSASRAAAKKRRPPPPPPKPQHGLLKIFAVIALMAALGAALGVLAAHLGH